MLVEDDGSVVGRFNLIFAEAGSAELGYRVAERAAGRGLATMAVRLLCELAATDYGVRTIVAATSLQNVASQQVLARTGFALVGPADPAAIGGKAGHRYERRINHAPEPR